MSQPAVYFENRTRTEQFIILANAVVYGFLTALISSTFVVPFYFAFGAPVAYAWLVLVLLAARWGWKRGVRSIAVKAEREAMQAARSVSEPRAAPSAGAGQ